VRLLCTDEFVDGDDDDWRMLSEEIVFGYTKENFSGNLPNPHLVIFDLLIARHHSMVIFLTEIAVYLRYSTR